jgi:hypothetical protein
MVSALARTRAATIGCIIRCSGAGGDCISCGNIRSVPHAFRTTSSKRQRLRTTLRIIRATGAYSFPRQSSPSVSSATTTSSVERKSLAINVAAISMANHIKRSRSSSTKTKGELSKYPGGIRFVAARSELTAAHSFCESLLYSLVVTAIGGRKKSDSADLMLIPCRPGFERRLNHHANGAVPVATSYLCRCVLTRFIAVANAGHRFIGCGSPMTR